MTQAEAEVARRSDPERGPNPGARRPAQRAARPARSSDVGDPTLNTALLGASLNTRKPTGIVPWPTILVEGEEKSGKSWLIAEFTADERVGDAYWLDLNEGAADEYASIGDYEVIVHDGTWGSILGQVRAVYAVAKQAEAAGEPPVVLAIDSFTSEWEMLKDWASNRAKKRRDISDQDADVKVSNDLWNDANARHARLMKLILTFPGIVILTAKGKWVAEIGPNGSPIEGKKVYRVEGQKNLAYDATAWIQMYRNKPAKLVGARSVHIKLRPGKDDPVTFDPDWSLAGFIFNELKAGQGSAVRDLVPLNPGDDAEVSDAFIAFGAAIAQAGTRSEVAVTWDAIKGAAQDHEISEVELGRLKTTVGAKYAQLPDEPELNTRAARDQDDANTRPAGADQ